MTAKRIWQEYEKGVSYNNALKLYDTVKKNENFYIGRQWEGLNTPDLSKPVINVLKRVVSYFVSMIVSDDIGVSVTSFDKTSAKFANSMGREISRVLEESDIKALAREALRDAAVDGDGALYFYYESARDNPDGSFGRIRGEVISACDVHFANPYKQALQDQSYIIVSSRKPIEEVRALAREGRDKIRTDSDNSYDLSGKMGDDLVTVLTKFRRENGMVYATQVTRDTVLRREWNTGLTLYPVAIMPWEKVKNSCRGVSALGAMIPNQIAINQLFAMAIHHAKTMAFPKIIYDASKIKSWSNKVGQAIATQGNPNDAIATSFKAQDMSQQVLTLIQNLTQNTLEFMGASDAALGNIRPDNTSAIIATQKASAMPLELQRLAYYRFTEDYVRIIMDMICTHYGFRRTENGYVDFSEGRDRNLSLKVDVGASTYWSELMQVQTLDNLFANGIITDAITYLEQLPDGYVSGKNKLIEKLKETEQLT